MRPSDKTVFICYRRSNAPWALAIFQHLTHRGFDVFFDFMGIGNGDFEEAIIENIRSRAHFLVLLTPSSLERCNDPLDWFRREIEEAIAFERNVIPVMLDSFDFGAPGVASHLTGKLERLKRYNGPKIYVEYFEAGMARLIDQFLRIASMGARNPLSDGAKHAAAMQQIAATSAPAVNPTQLTALEWFERGYSATADEEKLRCYIEAIRLQPDLAEAYNNRGVVRDELGDKDGAMVDYSEAIRLDPTSASAFSNRGIARYEIGDTNGALSDLDEAIRIDGNLAHAYRNRAIVRRWSDNWEGAMEDYDEAIRLAPDYVAYYNRAFARNSKGDRDGALRDYDEAIRLRPEHADTYNNRANIRRARGDIAGALTDYDEAIRLRPDIAEFYYNRGNTLRTKGDIEGANRDLAIVSRLGQMPLARVTAAQ